MTKNKGDSVCDCQPLLGQPQPRAGTLICSVCNFKAKVQPSFSKEYFPKKDMERIFKIVWGPEERAQYKYFLELMKPLETESLQAARTAYVKVERMRIDGTLEHIRALAQAMPRS